MKPNDLQLPGKPQHDHPWNRLQWGSSRSEDGSGGYRSLSGAKAKARKLLESAANNKGPRTARSGHLNIRITKDANGNHNIDFQNKYCELCAPEREHTVNATHIYGYDGPDDRALFKDAQARGEDISNARSSKTYIIPANPTETPPPHRMDV